MTEVLVPVGSSRWRITLPPEKLTAARKHASSSQSVRELVAQALEKPYDFEAMRRAITPDDRVVLVVEESLPQVGEAITAILEHLKSGGIPAEAVTVLTLPGSASTWVDDLPDEFADVRTEVHDANDRKKVAYLANTKSERRVYLNRGLVEAEFTIVLAGRGDGTGAETFLYPAFSDAESQTGGPLSRGDAVEIAKLIGSTFYVHCLEDGNGGLLEVVAGLANSLDEAARRYDHHWKLKLTELPDAVVVCVAGASPTFEQYANAARRAVRLVPEGRVILLGERFDFDSDIVRLLRHCDEPKQARKLLKESNLPSANAGQQWAEAATSAKLYLANLSDDEAEELWAYRVGNERELQKLLDSCERVLYLPDGERTIVELPETDLP